MQALTASDVRGYICARHVMVLWSMAHVRFACQVRRRRAAQARMQDKIIRRTVGSLQHTLLAIGLCQILAHGAHPHADRGVRIFPRRFSLHSPSHGGFRLITALVLSQNYATREWHWSG